MGVGDWVWIVSAGSCGRGKELTRASGEDGEGAARPFSMSGSRHPPAQIKPDHLLALYGVRFSLTRAKIRGRRESLLLRSMGEIKCKCSSLCC